MAADRAGHFKFASVRAGAERLEVIAADVRSVVVRSIESPLDLEQPLRIVIARDEFPTASIRLGVRGPLGEIPADAVVMTRLAGTLPWLVKGIGESGRQRLSRLIPGEYDFRIDAPGLAPHLGSFVALSEQDVDVGVVSLRAGGVLVLDSRCSLSAVVEEGVEIEIVDAKGRTVLDAVVALGAVRHGPFEAGRYTMRIVSEFVTPVAFEVSEAGIPDWEEGIEIRVLRVQ